MLHDWKNLNTRICKSPFKVVQALSAVGFLVGGYSKGNKNDLDFSSTAGMNQLQYVVDISTQPMSTSIFVDNALK